VRSDNQLNVGVLPYLSIYVVMSIDESTVTTACRAAAVLI